MAKPKETKQEEQQEGGSEAKNTKPEKKEVLTIASVFQKLGQQGAKDRKELAKKVIDYLAKKGVTTNGKGHTIREERVLQQISAMTRDINQNRGHKTNAWWSKFTVEEDKEKGYKLIPKA